MQNKIRLAQEQKIPIMLVLGDREADGRTATIRRRDAKAGDAQETVAWAELADRLARQSNERAAE